MSLSLKNQNCSQLPKLSNLTQIFLDFFGTGTLPAGYIEDDSYGPKTKQHKFAELFPVFPILIVLAVLCFLVFLSIIIILILYFRRRDYMTEPCKYSKWLTLLLITLLILMIILSALSLSLTIISINSLKKIYGETDDSSRIAHPDEDLDEVLIKRFDNERSRHLAKCENSPYLKDLYPHITRARHLSIEGEEKFKRFNRTLSMKLFKDILMRNDLFRTFTRQFHRIAEFDNSFVQATSSGAYRLKTLTPLDWVDAHKAISYMTEMITYFAKSARTDERKPTLCSYVKRYYDDLGDELAITKNKIDKIVNALFWKMDDQAKPPYKFGYVACIISGMVLALFLLILLCSCLRKRVGPLVFIFVLLAIVFILMSFVAIYHFSIGVIEYNGLCNKRFAEKTKITLFDDLSRKCTGVENIYTLISYDYKIQPIEEWDNMNFTDLENECKSFCTTLDTKRLGAVLDDHLHYFPDYGFCTATKLEQPWVDYILNFIQREPYKHLARRAKCNLNFLKKAKDFIPRARQANICASCIKLGKDILSLLPFIKREASELCTTFNQQCEEFRQEVFNSTEEFYVFRELAEERLRKDLGTCDLMLNFSNEKKREFCKCETFILNGVWVGALLFLLFLLIALLLLTCLMWLFVKCHGRRYMAESITGYGRDGEDVDAIVLPPIALPRNVVERLKADHNPRVKIYSQKT
ncbi:uncharacterized protein LOC101452927 isoform X2 [Ceratitis capitata]|uniref:Prominin-like protein n=1 Tax=Ceratitis capitata TaxID=7213 RepID=W8BD44_CERCA|nr:uncharacterized protein LOC101452927 isoform X2 [Ceratitis capitata]XP_020717255.1 uncharacterized protein LOC101452927 isoform X2 [Ceratitis capitata]